MYNRNFSDKIKYQTLLKNIKKNNSQLKCEHCTTVLKSNEEFHFDHVLPYSKGGKSNLTNCQILCLACNTRKLNKYYNDFILEEKATNLLKDKCNLNTNNFIKFSVSNEAVDKIQSKKSKDEIAQIINNFVIENGNITKSDLFRSKNNLPSFREIQVNWGGLKQLRKFLGIKKGIQEWNQENIKKVIEGWIAEKGDILQSDLSTNNGLPSLPSILRHFPNLSNFNEIKEFFGLKQIRKNWDKKSSIEAGINFVNNHSIHLRQLHLKKKYNLPSYRTIVRIFGNLREYQKLIGATTYDKNIKITKNSLDEAIRNFFGENARIVKNRSHFFNNFKFSPSSITNHFGSIDDFFKEYNIIEKEPKKTKYTKEEVDQMIIDFLSSGGKMPKQAKDLTKNQLPSADTIHKFYDSWREPFIGYSKFLQKVNKMKESKK